ncbi:hypothetical protein [Kitasatospora sp. NPDC057198]|uniref:hypothetical protein n=1 Tax=Kitasatospora sp. NPDC057198 TaxID=3346046 RepID=UPI003644A54E
MMGRLESVDGGGSGGFVVYPDELEQSGRTAQQTAEVIPGETGGILAASDQAEAGLRGWRTGTELNACTDEWKRLLDELSREMDSQGDKLIRTAANYRKGEEDAHRGLGTAGSGLQSLPGPSGTPALASAGSGAGVPGRTNPLEQRLLRDAFDGPQPTTQPGHASPLGQRLLRDAFDGPRATTLPHQVTPEEAERFGQATGRDPRLDFQVHHVEQPAEPDSFDLNAPVRGI